MVIAPTYKVLRDVSFKMIMQHLEKMGLDVTVSKQDFTVRFAENRSILFCSAEQPGRLRGKNLSWIWMDEAGEIKKEVFDIVIACLREGGRQGEIWATFTPKGRQHWTYETFGKPTEPGFPLSNIDESGRPIVELFTSATSANIFLHKSFEETIRRQYTAHYALQELQGRFIDLNAGVFQRSWFGLIDASPVQATRVRFWDKASTEGGGCYSVGVLMAKTPDRLFYVEHVVREQLSALGRNQLIKQTAEADRGRYGQVEIVVEQEPGSGGKESADYTIKDLAGFKVHAVRPSGNKIERAQPLAAQAEAGNVKLVRGSWNEAYLDELANFPEGVFADQVDASSGAFNRLALDNKRKLFVY